MNIIYRYISYHEKEITCYRLQYVSLPFRSQKVQNYECVFRHFWKERVVVQTNTNFSIGQSYDFFTSLEGLELCNGAVPSTWLSYPCGHESTVLSKRDSKELDISMLRMFSLPSFSSLCYLSLLASAGAFLCPVFTLGIEYTYTVFFFFLLLHIYLDYLVLKDRSTYVARI